MFPGDSTTIRCAIKEHRQRKGLSQDELARLVGLRRQAVYELEAGRYLPNTAVALRLARALGCTVEMLFVEDVSAEFGGLHLLHEAETARLFLAPVRGKLVGVPLSGAPLSFKLDVADAFLLADKTVDCLLPRDRLADTVLILGCDPALDVLTGLMAKTAPGIHAHAVFASSRRALLAVGDGLAHVAGTHYHGFGASDGNLEALQALLPGLDCLMIAFSVQEEGLMVAPGNPLGVRSAEDLAGIRLVNREEGAALRKLLDSELSRLDMPVSGIEGYTEEVRSHFEGAIRVAGGAADAALGLRIVAKSLGLDFVPLVTTRCDLVIPKDLLDQPGIAVLLDILQSSGLRKELRSLPGYDVSDVGKMVSGQGFSKG